VHSLIVECEEREVPVLVALYFEFLDDVVERIGFFHLCARWDLLFVNKILI
jgi:hypothetical protein